MNSYVERNEEEAAKQMCGSDQRMNMFITAAHCDGLQGIQHHFITREIKSELNIILELIIFLCGSLGS